MSDRSEVRDGGQATPLLALIVVVAGLLALMTAEVGVVVIDRARARTAADAAALAGVMGGRAAAESAARANHGRVERYRSVDGATEVVVRVGRARATARARPGPGAERRSPMGSAAPDRAPDRVAS